MSADCFSWPDEASFAKGNDLNEVVENLFLCGERQGADRAIANVFGIRLVVCCNANPNAPPFALHDASHQGGEEYAVTYSDIAEFRNALVAAGPRNADADTRTFVYNIAADDSPMFDLSPWFTDASHLLETMIEGAGARCLVHCMAGISRSATIIAAYLMRRTSLPLSAVLAHMQRRRSCVRPNPGFHNQLMRWELLGYCHFTGADASAAALRMAERMKGDSPITAAHKLSSYLSALLMGASSEPVNRAAVGLLGRALESAGVMSWHDFVDQVASCAEKMLYDDNATDCPVLPARIADCFVGLRREDGGDASMPSARWRSLVQACVCGSGDQFGFDPFPLQQLLGRFFGSAEAIGGDAEDATHVHLRAPITNVTWLHMFAARVRSVLEAGTPIAFSPDLGVNFKDLGLDMLDDWAPALQPHNTRRVLATCIRSVLRAVAKWLKTVSTLAVSEALMEQVWAGAAECAVLLEKRADEGDRAVEAWLADAKQRNVSPEALAACAVACALVGDPFSPAMLSELRQMPSVENRIDEFASEAKATLLACGVEEADMVLKPLW